MQKTITSSIKFVFLLSKNNSSIRVRTAGFTLPELLVASLILSLVVAVAGLGLVRILNANEKNTVEAERQAELNRALDFITDEIKTAKSVSITGIPLKNNYLGVFKLSKVEGGIDKEFAYYTAPESESDLWRGPRAVYRQQITPVLGNTYALVDAISNIDPTCTGTGNSLVDNKGLKVFVQDDAYVKVCLVGQLNNSRSLSLETQAFTRGRTP